MSQLDEWKTAREMVLKFDEHIHDVRKFGFTFLVTLLTAEALYMASAAPGTGASLDLAMGSSSVALLYLISMRFLERRYEVLQRMGARRCIMIERLHCLELSETIADKYRHDDLRNYGHALYHLFALAALIILLSPFARSKDGSVGLASLVGAAELLFFSGLYLIIPRLGRMPRGTPLFGSPGAPEWGVDVALDRSTSEVGGSVRVLLSNTTGHDIPLGHGRVILAFVPELCVPKPDDGTCIAPHDADAQLAEHERHAPTIRCFGTTTIRGWGCRTFVWDTSGVAPGLYRIRVHLGDGKHQYLRRSILLSPKRPDPKGGAEASPA